MENSQVRDGRKMGERWDIIGMGWLMVPGLTGERTACYNRYDIPQDCLLDGRICGQGAWLMWLFRIKVVGRRWRRYEANLSAESAPEKEESWVPGPDEDQSWSKCVEAAAE
jgi:hypothetical protein